MNIPTAQQELMRMLLADVTTLRPYLEFRKRLQEISREVRNACYQEDELAPIYREYLESLKVSAPKKEKSQGSIEISAQGTAPDISKLEASLANEHKLQFNPFSGFLCRWIGLDPEKLGQEIDSLLDPGGP